MPRLLFLASILLFTSTLIAQPLQTRKGSYNNSKYQNKGITAGCAQAVTSTEMALNNVRALIHTGGDMWWDFQNAQYEVPKGSGKTAMWTGSIWIGGTDVNGQLKKGKGDTFNYDYTLNYQVFEAFAQMSMFKSKWNFFIAANYNNSRNQRNGYFLNERFPENSMGKSKPVQFRNYGIKGGIK